MMFLFAFRQNQVVQSLPPQMKINSSRLGRSQSFKTLMGVDEILDDASQVEKISCPALAAKMTLGLDMFLHILIVSLDRIVVVPESMPFATNRYAKGELGRAMKQLPPRHTIHRKFVADKRDHASLATRLVPLAQVLLPYLHPTRLLDFP